MNLPHLPALETIELNFVISFLYCQDFILLSTNKTITEILSTDANIRTKTKGCRFLCENRLNSLLFVFQRQFRFWWRKLRMPILKTSTLLVRFHSLGVHVSKVSARFCVHSCNDAFLSADYEVKYCNFWDRGQSPRKLPFKWNLLAVLLRGGICFLAFYSYYKNFH